MIIADFEFIRETQSLFGNSEVGVANSTTYYNWDFMIDDDL